MSKKFVNNFKQFEAQASEAILAAAPKVALLEASFEKIQSPGVNRFGTLLLLMT